MDYKLNLAIKPFMGEFWQRQPCLIRQGFPDFVDPLDGDELAGLATLPEADSRLIRRSGHDWDVQQGPIRDFTGLGERDWTLLVQAVDHWIPDAAALLAPFRFLPNWRIDDLMVSYSVPGGGVGPHLDQYDVFIIQGTGCRRWRVGMQQPLDQHLPHPALKQVQVFEACIDVEMQPGDILYIPPGCPHEGYALQPSLNYSVGFRAPTTRELFSHLADHLLDLSLADDRFADPGRFARDSHHGRIDSQDIGQLVRMMTDYLSRTPAKQEWLVKMLSEPTRDLVFYPPESALDTPTALQEMAEGGKLVWVGGVRALYAESSRHLYVNGELWPVDSAGSQALHWIADHKVFSLQAIASQDNLHQVVDVLCDFFNRGWLEWYE